MTIPNKQINEKLNTILNLLESMDSRITALETSSSKKSVSATKSTSKKTASSKKSTKKSAPSQAQLDARARWGEAQHARAEARKELFAIVDTPEYKKEWAKWTKSKAYTSATRTERKALNKEKHAQIVAKLSK